MIYTKGQENCEVYKIFMQGRFRSKEDILKSLGKKRNKYEDLAQNDHSTPYEFYTMVCDMLDRFMNQIKDAVLLDELPDWWIYDYDLEYDRFNMYMVHVKEIQFDEESNEIRSWKPDARYDLIGFSFKKITSSEYAELYKVGNGTVRQWIRRGKIRSACKYGTEWMIPVLTKPPCRGYEQAQYIWNDEMDNLPDEYAFLNDFTLATFFQDRVKKEIYHCLLVPKKSDLDDSNNARELLLDSKDREKLELIMISRPEIRYVYRY